LGDIDTSDAAESMISIVLSRRDTTTLCCSMPLRTLLLLGVIIRHKESYLKKGGRRLQL